MADSPGQRVVLRIWEKRIDHFDHVQAFRREHHVDHARAMEAEKHSRLLHEIDLRAPSELLHEYALETEPAQDRPAVVLVDEPPPGCVFPAYEDTPRWRLRRRINT